MKHSFAMVTAILLAVIGTHAAETLTQTLQKGLFEEEANQNLAAAIQAYESVISQADEQRKLTATALYRLGECYRKLGKTNEATAQFRRILHDFSDQEQIVKLVSGPGAQRAGLPAPDNSPGQTTTPDEGLELQRVRKIVSESPDLANSPGRLHRAVESGYLSVVEFLLINGANANADQPGFNGRGRNPLTIAAGAGHKRMLELLLDHGAQVNRRDLAGATPLYVAAQSGFLSIVLSLLAHKAEIDAPHANGERPLHAAAANGFPAVVEALLQRGAAVNGKAGSSLYTPLHRAALNGHANIISLLIQHGAEVDSPDGGGATPLYMAVMGNFEDASRALLKAGANPNTKTKAGEPILMATSEALILQLLLDFKADPKATNQLGRTRIDSLIGQKQYVRSVQLLLDHGVDPNRNSDRGEPLLFTAVLMGNGGAVESLLDHHANPNLVINAETPISLCRSSKSSGNSGVAPSEWSRIEQLLLEHGANENLVRLSRITYIRPGWPRETGWVGRGTNDIDEYSLAEFFGSLWNRRPGDSNFRNPVQFPFPEFADITITRVDPVTLTNRDIHIDFAAIIRSGDCANDFQLAWGDRISIPESDHSLNVPWTGPDEPTREFLTGCLARRVQIVMKGSTNVLTLIPHFTAAGLRPSRDESKRVVWVSNFRLREAIYASALLRVSSDVTKVRVTRNDPKTKKPQSWLFDLTRISDSPGAEHNLWLRDGDVIEIPDKSESTTTEAVISPEQLRSRGAEQLRSLARPRPLPAPPPPRQ